MMGSIMAKVNSRNMDTVLRGATAHMKSVLMAVIIFPFEISVGQHIIISAQKVLRKAIDLGQLHTKLRQKIEKKKEKNVLVDIFEIWVASRALNEKGKKRVIHTVSAMLYGCRDNINVRILHC